MQRCNLASRRDDLEPLPVEPALQALRQPRSRILIADRGLARVRNRIPSNLTRSTNFDRRSSPSTPEE